MLEKWIDTLNAFSVTLRNVARPRVTEPLIWKAPREHPPRYRQTLALTEDENGEPNCIACGFCADVCPSQVIEVKSAGRRESPFTGKKRAYPESFRIDLNACMFCELCVQVCPNDSIVMLSTHQPPGFSREDQVLDMEKLLENGRKGPRAWASGSKLRAMQDPKRKPPAAGEEGK